MADISITVNDRSIGTVIAISEPSIGISVSNVVQEISALVCDNFNVALYLDDSLQSTSTLELCTNYTINVVWA